MMACLRARFGGLLTEDLEKSRRFVWVECSWNEATQRSASSPSLAPSSLRFYLQPALEPSYARVGAILPSRTFKRTLKRLFCFYHSFTNETFLSVDLELTWAFLSFLFFSPSPWKFSVKQRFFFFFFKGVCVSLHLQNKYACSIEMEMKHLHHNKQSSN